MGDEGKYLDYLKRVTIDLRKTRRRLLDLEEREREPIAIVGMGCRYPGGVRSPQDLWELVAGGIDAIGGMPDDRGWDLEKLYDPDPDRSGTTYTREGGFLYDAADFDAGFFGVSPSEALAMDPQQRLLLECCWDVLENACIDPASLRGTDTGVFAGVIYGDYGSRLSGGSPPEVESYLGMGSAGSVASGRVAYTFGFEGPAITVDTACSSSLVALHLACQALRSEECSMAIAGGVTVFATPGLFVEFARQRGLAVDGRCKSFADSADGTGWSEGVGLLALERLADARRNGHRVLAVVRGSAVNQDGTSNGLTAPNGPAQQRVIRAALTNAGLSAHQVDVVEAHGTGTRLGDPIEAQALLATYGQERQEGRPLWLGSVKSNIGHTQAAAGVAGVIKMVMAMRQRSLPKTLHLDEPTKQVDWKEGMVSLLAEARSWESQDQPRRAAVSSFGVSGTNAHVILEEPSPVPEDARDEESGLRENVDGLLGGGIDPWVLSARDADGLRAQADRLHGYLNGATGPASTDTGLVEVGRALARRPLLEHRAVLLGNSDEDLLSDLDHVGRGDTERVVEGLANAGSGKVVFVFPGQGAQWPGMAVGLLEGSPVFADWIGRCSRALEPFVDWRLEDVLLGATGAPDLDRVDVVQPVLFAVMVALAELWRECGVLPDAVVGHSQGEIAAAHIAGALSLQDASRVVAVRSRALASLSGLGGMVSIALGIDELESILGPLKDRVSVAAINGPAATVVSGEHAALDELLERCEQRSVRARKIPVDYAAHSIQVQEIRDELLAGCESISPRSATVPFYSTTLAAPLDGSLLDGAYWYRNLRECVQFEPVVGMLAREQYATFIEMSPHPVLTVGVQETLDAVSAGAEEDRAGAVGESAAAVFGSLRRQEGGPERFVRSLAEAWAHGVQVDWTRVLGSSAAEPPDLPTYPFQRRRYWLDGSPAADVASVGQAAARHPLLGAEVALAGEAGWLFTGRLAVQSHPWLAEHAVAGTLLLPGAALLELALHAGQRAGCGRVHELTLESPLVLDEQAALQLQVSVGAPDEDGLRSLHIDARAEPTAAELVEPSETWIRHASGLIGPELEEMRSALGDWSETMASRLAGEWPPPEATALPIEDLYETLADRGLEYGPAFQGLERVWRDDRDIFAEVSLSSDQRDRADAFGLHPALLDAALHALASSASGKENDGPAELEPSLPYCWRGVSLHAAGVSALRVGLRRSGEGAVSLWLANDHGVTVASIESLTVRPIPQERLRSASADAEESLLGVHWKPVSHPGKTVAGRWSVLGSEQSGWCARLQSAGGRADCHVDLDSLALAVSSGTSVPEITLWECAQRVDGDGLAGIVRMGVHEVLKLLQGWLSSDELGDSRLLILTRGGVATQAGEQVSALPASATWGFVRSIQSESPGRLLLVDIDEEESSEQALVSAALFAIAEQEPQVAIRNGVVYVPRLARSASGALSVPDGAGEWRLDIRQAGSLDGLRLIASPEAAEPLLPGQVRVRMRAGGMNFKDVVVALGLLPGHEHDVVGREGAGIVSEVAPDVTGVRVGDRVMGLFSGCFGSQAITDERLVVRVPDGWSFVDGASVPVAFLTAYYGLLDLAQLREGERLLVHAAAGGVGMAAVQIARHLGVEVFATASPSKWGTLATIGCDEQRVASSRDLDFRERFLSVTAGAGVDVVLNSLTGEFVDASLELLPRGGRFIEMGKTDIREVGELADEHPSVAYTAFDLSEAAPDRIQEMLLELVRLFEQGVLRRLPVRTWDVRRAPEAFRFMGQARHTGKIVLTQPSVVHGEGTTLITGGTGQIGAALARHLVSASGVRDLILTSRRGLDAPGAGDLQDELTALGARVQIAECDVSDRAQLKTLIQSIPEDRPLTGVVHAAGVLDDGTLGSLTVEQVDRVLAPKVDGAVNLHELTQHLDLRAFVLFSSAAGILGSPGQANYAAANAFVDALALDRRARGMAASSMAWGLWRQSSEMTAQMDELDVVRMKRSGVRAMSSDEGLELFDAASSACDALTVPALLDVSTLRAQARSGVLPALLRELIRTPAARSKSTGAGPLARRLAELAEQDRGAVVIELVRAQVAAVLGHQTADAIPPDRTFKDLGFDSLLGVELRNRLARAAELRLPATLIFDYPTPVELAGRLLEELEGAKTSLVPMKKAVAMEEPIAIVGMGCRYPGGVRSPEELWSLVAERRDAISDLPADRGWDLDALRSPDPDRPGASWAQHGSFLDDVAGFDPEFFGIGPREALAMDPQQRLLLEVCWEAIEHAGIDPLSLRGAPAGVFAGISASGYDRAMSASASGTEGYRLTGSVTSAATGRVAYTLGLEGPALSVDTACSSSLVALHLACQALRQGECSLALAGGVSVMAVADLFVEFSRQGGMSRDGRCKSFSAEADGAGWSEGAGMLVMERLSEAQRLGHPIVAVIRGSAVNQDGASNGLTAPNGLSQQRVIAQALANAGLVAREVDAVEAHGTGTRLGDPIEAQALIAAYGRDREGERPLLIGSLKSNIGHATTAAGVAGVIKMAMALKHGVLPPTLHVERPSAEIDWSDGTVELLKDATPWPANGKPRRAGVSSFGISGTNAHTILEEAPIQPVTRDTSKERSSSEETSISTALPWAISASSAPGLRAQAQRLLDHLDRHPELHTADSGFSLSGRPALRHRAVVVGDRGGLLGGVRGLAEGKAHPAVTRAEAGAGGKVAFLFTGQGAQRLGMGSALSKTFPAFKQSLERVCEHFGDGIGPAVLDLTIGQARDGAARESHGGDKGGAIDEGMLDRTMYAQPALFAFEVALFRLIESWGVKPDFLLGHSVGELAAAHVGGVFSLKDACALVLARGRLMDELPAGGAMVAVQASEEEALGSLADVSASVALAAVNGPASVVLSGDEQAIELLSDSWSRRGRKTRRLTVSHAFHSPRMDRMLARFGQETRLVEFAEPSISIVSNLTGEIADGELCDPDYWVRHVRETVRFADGVRRLSLAGADHFLEVGPDGVLSAMVRECLGAEECVVAPLARAGRSEIDTLLAGLAELWTHGGHVDWQKLLRERGGRRVELPTYAFQRRRYWLDGGSSETATPALLGQRSAGHPLLGAAVAVAEGGGLLLTGRVSLQTHTWLADHVVGGVVLMPGAALVELALKAGFDVGCSCLGELVLEAPMPIPPDAGIQLQVSIGEPDVSGSRNVSIHSQPYDASAGIDTYLEDRWTRNASGVLRPPETSPAGSHAGDFAGLAAWPPPDAEALATEDLYERLSDRGLDYGAAFQGVGAAWRRGEELFAEVALASDLRDRAESFDLHPALLDAALHVAAADLQAGAEDERQLWLPFSWRGVELHARGAEQLRVRVAPAGEDSLSLTVSDQYGSPVLSIVALHSRSVSAEQLDGLRARASKALFEVRWTELAGAHSSSELTDVELVTLDSQTADTVPTGVHERVGAVLELLRSRLSEREAAGSRFALVTQDAVLADPGEPGVLADPGEHVSRFASAAAWGLARCAQLENPGRFLLIDVDGDERSRNALPWALEAGFELGESQLAIRCGSVLVPRLVQVDESSAAPVHGEWFSRSQGTVLLTGGTGGLGPVLAKHLVREHGVRHLLLASKRGADAPGAGALARELSELGARVAFSACDVSDREQVKDLLASVEVEHPLCGVVHAAGVVEDGVIASLTAEQVDRVLAPKVDGAWHLHELTADLGLDAFVLFSSVAGTLGSPGQGNYGAANAFLDALAAHRGSLGLPALSLAWGAWEQEAGMAGGLGALDRARIARSGVRALSSERGLRLFDMAGAIGRPVLIPVDIDRSALRAQAKTGVLPALLREIAPIGVRRVADALGGSLMRLLGGASESERQRIALDLVRGETAAVLGHGSGAAIEPRRSFKELGFDSLAAVDLRNRLEALSGLRLSATVVFDYPNAAALADYLLELASGETRPYVPAMPARRIVEEPIAIVGMSCRYPGGVSSPEELWQLVAGGVDAISPFPRDRGWDLEGLYDPDPDHAGTSYASEGGFVGGVGDFDSEFFGLGPREALAMDPQQRLLLETSWEAFEDAGIDPASLRGSPTGVFAGVMYQDYATGLSDPQAAALEGYRATGGAGSVVSGRVAYTFGLEGPAVSIDTACSSSLVALHWACQSLRSGECSMALAGGVTVLWMPGIFVEFSRQRGLARDGRCKSYSNAADGTGWGEGVGMLVLERLSDAKRNGHTALAVIRGSAINQDGASNGLSSPNGPSQQNVIRQALANAGLSPGDVDAVEGHGTGTTLGDPIEAQALLATYGQSRPAERPLRLGSIKSNIGHTQAAAGAAGVIKMVLAMRHGLLPRTLHVDRPSSEVDWSAGAVSLLRDPMPWPREQEPRRAGVSSFGISGTNAHLILEDAPLDESIHDASSREGLTPADNDVLEDGSPHDRGEQATGDMDSVAVEHATGRIVPWVLSGGDAQALCAQAGRLVEYLASSTEPSVADIGYSLTKRPMLPARAVVLSEDRDGLFEGLGVLAGGGSAPNAIRTPQGWSDAATTGAVALLFSGQGTQRRGMGQELYRELALYRHTFDEVCGHLDRHLAGSVREVTFEVSPGSEQSTSPGRSADQDAQLTALDRTAFAQASLFALEVALYRVVESWGLQPDFLVGHSIGELTAAYVSGVFSLEDACKLVAARGRLMGELPTGGAMVAIQASEQEIRSSLADFEGLVAIAAINGPSSVVLSGEEEAVGQLADLWRDRSRKTKRLRVSHAFHSHRMDDMLDHFAEVVEEISFGSPRIPIVSNLTGETVDSERICSVDYWVCHVRETVRFGEGIAWLGAQGVRCFLELGPDGALSAITREILGGDGTTGLDGESVEVLATPLLRDGRPESATLMSALAEAFVAGVGLDWDRAFADSSAKRVNLPTYAFQRRRYWVAPRSGGVDMASAGQSPVTHPLLGAAVELAGERRYLFTGRVSLQDHPWLADHAAMGVMLLPGTAFLDLALHVGREIDAELVRELTLEAPLVIEEDAAALLQVSVGEPDDSGHRALDIHSRSTRAFDGPHNEEMWTRHATGMLAPAAGAGSPPVELESMRGVWPPLGAESVDMTGLYDRVADHGLDYGPAFQGLRTMWRSGGEVFAEVSLPEAQHSQAGVFEIHPALLDAAFHAAIALDAQAGDGAGPLRLPFSFGGVRLGVRGTSSLRVALSEGPSGVLSMLAVDEAGVPVVRVESLVAREVAPEQLANVGPSHGDSLFAVRWRELLGESDAPVARWALLDEHGSQLAHDLREAGFGGATYQDVESLAQALGRGEPPPEIVLVDCVTPSSEDGVPALLRSGVNRALEIVRQWLAEESLSDCRLVLLTSGAVTTSVGADLPGLSDSAVWGLIQSAQTENPDRFVLVDHDGERASWEALQRALTHGEPRVALRQGTVLVPRIEHLKQRSRTAHRHALVGEQGGASGQRVAEAGVLADERGVFDPQKTVLITGGTGGLGALVAHHLVRKHGVRNLLLVSRRGLEAPGAGEVARELVELGAEVGVMACDVGVREQLDQLLGSIDRGHPLGAVVHTAATLDNGLVDSLTAEQFDRVLAAKADAAWHLHELTAELELSAFVLFSSIAGLFGGPGQGNYAAANVFLDRLAEHRRARGLPATSVAWSLWSEAGAGTQLGELDVKRVVGSSSVGLLTSEQGLELFDLAIASEEAAVLAARLDLSVLRAETRAGVVAPLLSDLVRVPTRQVSSAKESKLADRLASIPREERAGMLLTLVRTEAAQVLGHSSPEAIVPTRAFKEAGFDSLAAVELRNRLGVATGLRLSATLVFDYPSPQELAGYLLDELSQELGGSAASVEKALDEVERMISAIAKPGPDRQRVRARLNICLSTLQEEPIDSKSVGEQLAEDDLESASDDEMFRILDSEFEAS
jgi:acyl transferase domain-containing protein/D-arabinose 1-dehydrogenase-like Zn-dependent alcohol dehydrogenase/acyl carrier protein